MKKIPKTKRMEAHTPKSPRGMGDSYGVGVKQKMGRVRVDYLHDTTPAKNLKKPPKSLA